MLSDTLHLQRLVNDLLELSRLQNSDFNIIKTDLSLTDLLTDTVRSMQRIAGGKHVGIQLDNQAGLVVISGDYNRLRQMFITILDNSIKFSPPHTVINVRMYCENSLCIISFTDYGNGILPQDLPYIFNRFYKKTSEQNESGSGLGLPIAKQIADRHNITITWESELEDHTTFFFAFPEGTWERFTETIGESLS
jgi:signal transduction histidine kinase